MKKIELRINGKRITADVASTALEKKRGLNGTVSLPKNKGMLFDFRNDKSVFMTAEKMHYPIDILFISGSKVVDYDVAKPKTERIDTNEDFDYVLEVNVDTFLKKYIKNAKVEFLDEDGTWKDLDLKKEVPKFKAGGKITKPDYIVKIDDVPIEKDAAQILDKKGAVAANIKEGARVFSRIHTLQLAEHLRDDNTEGLAEVIIKALDQQETQEDQYV